jgi:predicted permease
MKLLDSLRAWISAVLHPSQVDEELEEELRQHIEVRAAEHERGGLPRAEAERRARIEFGGRERIKEECREAAGTHFFETLKVDVRFGARMLRKNPGFALIAILTLGLGIGASAAVFSVVNAILLKPLPYPNANRIVFPWLVSPPGVTLGSEYFPWGQTQFQMVVRQANPFHDLGAFQNASFNLTGSGEPALLDGFRTSAGFFSSLGVSAVVGRTYSEEDDQPGHEHVVVLSHRLWQEKFGGDRGILGRSIELNGAAYAVIGVMPADFAFPRAEEMPVSFDFPRRPELWVPLAIAGAGTLGPSELAVVGGLKPGVTVAEAQAQMDVITKNAEIADPRWKGWFNMRLVPLEKQVVGETQRPLLLVLGSVGIVLLIACTNVANLLLARAFARKREFTLRAALGGGRGRLARQILTESLLLAMSGGALGLFVAQAGVYFVRKLGPANIPRLQEVVLDWHVLAFLLAVSMLTGMLFGVVPAVQAARENIVESLKEGGQRSGGGPTHPRLRNALLVSQVALALVLVVSAGLLVRTFYHLLSVDPGFRPAQVYTFQLSLPQLKYPDQEHMVPLYARVLENLRAQPVVQDAGIAETLPMGGEGESTVITIVDHPVEKDKQQPFANFTIISPGYFSAVGASILRGRGIAEQDGPNAAPVAVINAAMAKKYWPGEDPIGKRVGLGSPRFPIMSIVGIVADIKHFSMREAPLPELFVPYTQKQWPSMLTMHVALRARADAAPVTVGVREAVHAADADLPVAKFATLTNLLDDSLTEPRFAVVLLTAFAGLALLLATIGMYGVISYSVAQRTQEIGVRMALGAERGSVFGMVLAQGARLAGLGIGIGLLSALGVTRLMTSFLYGVQATDPPTFAGVSLLLVAVALLACYLPARRATRVDPMVALRHE